MDDQRHGDKRTDVLGHSPTHHYSSAIRAHTFMPSLGSLPRDTMITERYRVLDETATHGGEADVYKCCDLEKDQLVAVKVYRANYHPNESLLQKLLSMRHRNLVELIDFGTWNDRSYEVMKYATGGTLFDHSPFDEKKLTDQVIPQVVEALHFLHEHRIIHKDLKPTNIYFSDGDRRNILVGDYGISSLVGGMQSLHQSAATKRSVEFTAPERFSGLFGYEVDYYSLGITLITLLKGRSPFEGMDEAQIIYSHLTPAEHDFIPSDCTAAFKKLIRGLLHKHREHRWGNTEVRRWLNGDEVELFAYDLRQHGNRFIYKLDTNITAQSPEELAMLMLEYPEKAKMHIRQTPFFDTFNLYDQDLASQLHSIRESASSLEEAFIEIVYTLNPGLPYRFVDGCEVNSPVELARIIDRDSQTWEEGKKQLNNGTILAWLRATGYGRLADQWSQVADRYQR